MTDISALTSVPKVAKNATGSVELPAPVPFGVPVLIGDCTTPLAGETVLTLIWKRMNRDDQTNGE